MILLLVMFEPSSIAIKVDRKVYIPWLLNTVRKSKSSYVFGQNKVLISLRLQMRKEVMHR